MTKIGNGCKIGSKGEVHMIENYLLVGLGWFLLGIVIDWVIDGIFSKDDDIDEYIKSLQDTIDSLNDEIESREELIENQQKMITLQKIAIDTYKDVLASKEFE